MFIFTKNNPMTAHLNKTENCPPPAEKKAWSSPVFQIIDRDIIKSGVTHKATPEGAPTSILFTYLS